MPIFTEDQTLDDHKVGHFGYSAVPLDALQATQFTLATLVIDRSGSTGGFTSEITDAVKAAVIALQRHPLNAQILLRVLAFDNYQEEIHGFIPVMSIDPDRYQGQFLASGMTALYDACVSAGEATVGYSSSLAGANYLNNGIIIVITDGVNNAGKFNGLGEYGPVRDAFKGAVQKETLESLVTILIGVNVAQCKDQLQEFQKEAKFTQPMLDVDTARDADAIARVGRFISSSISSTSMVLGTGGPSQSLQF